MTIEIINKVKELYKQKFEHFPTSLRKLPQSGSYRQYYRITFNNKTCIGVYNKDVSENKAFFSFTESFNSLKLPVPRILNKSKLLDAYLIEDLGDITVFNKLKEINQQNKIIELYKNILNYLIIFQFEGHGVIDYSQCYPRENFDSQSILWDLNYFKYNFLKFLKINYNEQQLENDFNVLISLIEKIPLNTFLYRDFQSSNIMIKHNSLHFIDYQGGRRGAFYYDLASLLFDAKADLEDKTRENLKEYYYTSIKDRTGLSKNIFEKNFTLFVLIRVMQAMGAYGFRGLFERKEQFINSIPYAIKNLKYILTNYQLSDDFPELTKVFHQLIKHPDCQFKKQKHGKLAVRINSFSYKKGIPHDKAGNGGGFVFDCRSLPNPGRYSEFKGATGKDPEVINFFKDKSEVHDFLEHVLSMIDITIKDYIKRKRTDLMINFGCTGGQHRSVYLAEHLAKYLQQYDIDIDLKHLELENV